MHAPECSPLSIERDAALHKLRIEAAFLELLLAPAAREEAAIIVPGLDVDLEDTGQFRLAKYHPELYSFPRFRLMPAMPGDVRARVAYARMNGNKGQLLR